MAFLKEINDNKDSLLQLVNDLLDYSKIEANTLAVSYTHLGFRSFGCTRFHAGHDGHYPESWLE